MEESVLTSVVLPLSLFLIMLGLGISLTPADFQRVALSPRAAAGGLLNQVVLLPLVGFGLAMAFGMTSALAVGVVLIAACPGGVTSNLITHASRGDTALSVSLTAVTSVLCVLTVPFLLGAAYLQFMGVEKAMTIPVGEVMKPLVAITFVPIALGMTLRHFRPALSASLERPVRIASTVIFVLLLLAVIGGNLELIRTRGPELIGVTTALNLVTMALGVAVAAVLKLDIRQTLTVVIESGIQNGTLAIVVATSILQDGEIALPAGIYSLVMFVTGGLVIAASSRLVPAESPAPLAA